MIIRFIGDIHLGKRPPHSTNASAQRYKECVDKVVKHVAEDNVLSVSLGDVFDSYSVSNTDLTRAISLLSEVDFIVKGNHDHAHNSYNTSALEDFATLTHTVLLDGHAGLGQTYPVTLHAVPYQPTQELFKQRLRELQPHEGGMNILCLHTNMHAEAFGHSETENNLTQQEAERLCGLFDLVISGHEHNACIKHGVVMVGSVMPTSFGDMSAKYIVDFDTDTKVCIHVKTWDMDGYAQLSAAEFLRLPTDTWLQFVEIVGEVSNDMVLPVAKHMGKVFAGSESIISIKNATKTVSNQSDDAVTEQGYQESPLSWAVKVSQNLTEVQDAIFKELL